MRSDLLSLWEADYVLCSGSGISRKDWLSLWKLTGLCWNRRWGGNGTKRSKACRRVETFPFVSLGPRFLLFEMTSVSSRYLPSKERPIPDQAHFITLLPWPVLSLGNSTDEFLLQWIPCWGKVADRMYQQHLIYFLASPGWAQASLCPLLGLMQRELAGQRHSRGLGEEVKEQLILGLVWKPVTPGPDTPLLLKLLRALYKHGVIYSCLKFSLPGSLVSYLLWLGSPWNHRVLTPPVPPHTGYQLKDG